MELALLTVPARSRGHTPAVRARPRPARRAPGGHVPFPPFSGRAPPRREQGRTGPGGT